MVEHLDGMNRFRIGLHIPGNVIVACKRCNNAKRPDDQREILHLAESGWRSFLSHDGTRCPAGCKTCAYWQMIWPTFEKRQTNLVSAIYRIDIFRASYPEALEWSVKTRETLKDQVNVLYRLCQEYAQAQIQEVAQSLFDTLL